MLNVCTMVGNIVPPGWGNNQGICPDPRGPAHLSFCLFVRPQGPCTSVFLSICQTPGVLHICLSFYLPRPLGPCTSVYLSICQTPGSCTSICLSVYLSDPRVPAHMTFCLFVRPQGPCTTVYLSICQITGALHICLSVYLPDPRGLAHLSFCLLLICLSVYLSDPRGPAHLSFCIFVRPQRPGTYVFLSYF